MHCLPGGCRCFHADVDKYVYEICPFKDAHQRDGAAATSLGAWKGFEDAHAAMLFAGGQHCWNGPQRSIKARLPAALALLKAARFIKDCFAMLAAPNAFDSGHDISSDSPRWLGDVIFHSMLLCTSRPYVRSS
jgi:hypothetical protein